MIVVLTLLLCEGEGSSHFLLKRNVAMSNYVIQQPVSVKPCLGGCSSSSTSIVQTFTENITIEPSVPVHQLQICIWFWELPECSISLVNVQFPKRSSLIKTGLFGPRLYHWVNHLTFVGWWVWKILNILQAHFYQKQLMDMAAAK